MTAPSASSAVDIAAPASVVYGLITDLTTLAELASETTSMAWRRGTAAAPGAVFTGANRNGRRSWSTKCTVTDTDPGRRFAFEVTHTLARVSRWQYDIEAKGSGCRVTESTWDRRPAWFKLPAELATGVRNRAEANAVHIEETLRRLKARAEAAL